MEVNRSLLPKGDTDEPVARNGLAVVTDQLIRRAAVVTLSSPRVLQEIAADLRSRRDTKACEIAKAELAANAEVQRVKVKLSAEEMRQQLLVQSNEVNGKLFRENQALIARNIMRAVESESRDQESLAASDVAPEDRGMLAQFIKGQAAQEIQAIAIQHSFAANSAEDDHNN